MPARRRFGWINGIEKGIIVMWRKYLKTLASVLVLALVFTMFVPVPEAEAASGKVSQNGLYSNKIVLDIPESAYPSNATSIDRTYVEVRSGNNTQTVFNQAGAYSQITITGVSPTYQYNVYVYCDYSTRYGSYTKSTVGYVYNAALAPTKVTGLTQKNWWCYICSLDTTWNKQASVTGYQYELYNYKGAKVKSGISKYPSGAYADFNKLVLQTYKMRVRAYTTFNGKTTYGAWSNWLEIVPPVKSLTGKAKKKKVSLKWSKVPGATSYTIFVSTKKDSGYKATKTVKKNKVTIKKIGKKKLKSKKTYYIYVRPNRKVNGKDVFSTFANSSTIILYGRVR